MIVFKPYQFNLNQASNESEMFTNKLGYPMKGFYVFALEIKAVQNLTSYSFLHTKPKRN